MDDQYILEKLKKLIPLFYGKGYENWAFAEKRLDYYCFGYHDGTEDCVTNKVSKPVAIYLVAGRIEGLEKQDKVKRTK